LYLGKVEFGWPTPVVINKKYVFDKDFFWVPKNYYLNIKAAKYNNPSIVFMGDSCTELGAYHKYLADLMYERTSIKEVLYLNCGITGWSSYQGLQQLKKNILDLKPKIVTIYYGWNDHWIGFGLSDKNVALLNASFISKFQKFRCIQLMIKTWVLVWRKIHKIEKIPQRVSPGDYRKNLREMVILTKAQGIIPILLTAPSSLEKGKEPKHLTQRWIKSLTELIPLHRKYNSIVRDVAVSEEAILCDLDKGFNALSKEELRDKYFIIDGIHLTKEGNKKIAEFLYDCFEKNALLKYIGTPK